MTIYEEQQYKYTKRQLEGKTMTVKEYLEIRDSIPSHDIVEWGLPTKSEKGTLWCGENITVEALKERYLNESGSFDILDDEIGFDDEFGRMITHILRFNVYKEDIEWKKELKHL